MTKEQFRIAFPDLIVLRRTRQITDSSQYGEGTLVRFARKENGSRHNDDPNSSELVDQNQNCRTKIVYSRKTGNPCDTDLWEYWAYERVDITLPEKESKEQS